MGFKNLTFIILASVIPFSCARENIEKTELDINSTFTEGSLAKKDIEFVAGDFNSDEVFDIKDVVLMTKSYFEGDLASSYVQQLDMDFNWHVDYRDSIHMLNRLFNWEEYSKILEKSRENSVY